MRKDILIKKVKEEAKKLRELATKKELNNLKFNRLDPNSRSGCIYGQMTGNCKSERAIELIEMTCKKVYKKGPSEYNIFSGVKLNGSPKGKRSAFFHGLGYLSPIEVFIYQEENKSFNNKILIDYLKGKTKILNFKSNEKVSRSY